MIRRPLIRICLIHLSNSSGFSPTSIETKDKFSVDNLDVAGVIDSSAITEADLMSGIYDYAEVEIFMVNVLDLTQGIILHRRGWVGEISLKNKSNNLLKTVGFIFI